MSFLSFEWNAADLSGTHAEATENVSAELSKMQLGLFEFDVALDVYNSFSDYTPCSDESDRAEGSILHLAHLYARIARVVNCPTEWEKRGGHRQKM